MKRLLSFISLLGFIITQATSGQENRGLKCVQILDVGELNDVMINTTSCSSEGEICLRTSGSVVIEGQESRFLLAGCFSEMLCSSPCEDFIALGFHESDDTSINITSCDLACCNSNFCNNQTTKEIKKTQPVSSPTTSTFLTNRGSPRCSDFLSISGEESIDYSSCTKTSDTLCYRVEAEIASQDPSNSKIFFVHAGCVSKSFCQKSCNSALESFYGGLLENISSCDQACCSGNNCNNRSLNEIRNRNPTSNFLPTPTTLNTRLRSSSSSSQLAPSASTSSSSSSNSVTSATTKTIIPLSRRCADFVQIPGEESAKIDSCFQASGQLCHRLEAEVVLSNYSSSVQTFVLGDCIERLLCNTSCQAVLESTLDENDIEIRSCRHSCCNGYYCNNQSMNEMQSFTTSLVSNNPQTTKTTRSDFSSPRRPRPLPPRQTSNNTVIIVVVLGSVVVICLTAIVIVVIKKKRTRKHTQNGSKLNRNAWNQQSGPYESVGPALPKRNSTPDYVHIQAEENTSPKNQAPKESVYLKPIPSGAKQPVNQEETTYIEPIPSNVNVNSNESTSISETTISENP